MRFAWAKTEALIETIRLYFGNIESSAEQREAFVQDYMKTTENLQYVSPGRSESNLFKENICKM